MWQILSKLHKNLVWSIPISMSLGLLFGYLFDAQPLKQFIIPVTFVMVYPMMATLNVKSIFQGGDYRKHRQSRNSTMFQTGDGGATSRR